MRAHCRWWPVLLGLLVAEPAWGQNDLARSGFWIGFGAGLRSPELDLDTSGFTGSATIGYDIVIGRRFAIAPHATWLQAFAAGETEETFTGVFASPDSPGRCSPVWVSTGTEAKRNTE